MTVPTILFQANHDAALIPQDIRVLLVALDELDPAEFRPLKIIWLARVLRLAPETAFRSLERLVLFGYLLRAPRTTMTEPYRYRLAPICSGANARSA